MQFHPWRVAFVISAKRIITSPSAGCNDSLHTQRDVVRIDAALAPNAICCYE